MSYIDLARSRYSCRLFEDRPVEQAVVDAIVEAGRIAPSACNNHPSRVMVLDTPELLKKAAACQPRFASDGSIFGAPLIFLICSVTDDAWVRPYDQMNSSAIDTSIVCDQMMMEAEEQGLGTCWVCHFKPEVACEQFRPARGHLSLSHARLRLSCRPYRRPRAARGPHHSPPRLPPQVDFWDRPLNPPLTTCRSPSSVPSNAGLGVLFCRLRTATKKDPQTAGPF